MPSVTCVDERMGTPSSSHVMVNPRSKVAWGLREESLAERAPHWAEMMESDLFAGWARRSKAWEDCSLRFSTRLRRVTGLKTLALCESWALRLERSVVTSRVRSLLDRSSR